MLIQTLCGELLSVEVDKETTLEEIKEKIAEMDPHYHPFTQVLCPLREGPLRPFHPEEPLGLVQQRVRIQCSKPCSRILLNSNKKQLLWGLTFRFTRKKGTPKRVEKEIFLYDPVQDRYALSFGFERFYRRNSYSSTFLVSRTEEITWYSTVREVLQAYYSFFPSVPLSDDFLLDTAEQRWAPRKQWIHSEQASVTQRTEQEMESCTWLWNSAASLVSRKLNLKRY